MIRVDELSKSTYCWQRPLSDKAPVLYLLLRSVFSPRFNRAKITCVYLSNPQVEQIPLILQSFHFKLHWGHSSVECLSNLLEGFDPSDHMQTSVQAHTQNFSTQEVEAGGPEVQGYFLQHSKLKTSLTYEFLSQKRNQKQRLAG